jgi:hypothetical protein
VAELMEEKINRDCYKQFNFLLPNDMTYEEYLVFMDKLKDVCDED